MALKDCKECGKPVSTEAAACPSCGAKPPKSTSIMTWIIGIFMVAVIGSYIDRNNSSSSPALRIATPDLPQAATPPLTQAEHKKFEAKRAADEAAKTDWVYSKNDDAMSGKVVRFAQVTDPTSFHFSFPYNGKNHATLNIREHPKHGTDLYIKIDKGQLICSAGGGCNVSIRIDDKPARTYAASGAADYDSTILFINQPKKLIAEIKKSKIVRIKATVYNNGDQIMTFNTDGLVW